MNSFYTKEELLSLNFKSIGNNVLISKKASIYSSESIEIGSNVRIDDFCILSGKITLGNNIHIAAYSALYGGNVGIIMKDFSGVSSRVSIYAISDNYSGNHLTNPTVPNEYRDLIEGNVVLERHVIVGASSVILPGIVLSEGTSIGSMSLVNKSTKPWTINVGIPCKYLKERSNELLKLEKTYYENIR